MKQTKKTILTLNTTMDELRACLTAYQGDMMQELVAELYRKEDGKTVDWRDAAKFGLICIQNECDFDDLLHKTNTPWIATPKSLKGWVDLFISSPYLFGVTDDVATEDVQEVILFLDGQRYEASELLKNI